MKMTSSKKIDAISDTLRILYETAENNMVAEVNRQLISDGLSGAVRNQAIRRRLSELKITTDNIVDKVLGRVSETEGIVLDKLSETNRITTSALVQSAAQTYNKQIARVIGIRSTIPLRQALAQEAERNIVSGLKITYQNKRNIGYKEYMEMATRTSLQREVGSSQLSSGGRAGVVFYISNHYADCADDHKAYQGKFYYDERYKEFGYDADTLAQIERIISGKRMLSIQAVRDDSPYLTTRPNCRHTLTPVSFDQAGGKAEAVVKDLNLSTGSYKDENYDDSQKQRYNERQIRFYKNRMAQHEALPEVFGDDTIQGDKLLIRKWQAEQRKLVDSNPVLSRDYRRETEKLLLKDVNL